jgi:hypothetical protein
MSLIKKKGQYRFFYHYYKQYKKMSFHFKDEPCHVVDNIVCKVPCETKWNKTQPNLVLRGWASGYSINNNILTIF